MDEADVTAAVDALEVVLVALARVGDGLDAGVAAALLESVSGRLRVVADDLDALAARRRSPDATGLDDDTARRLLDLRSLVGEVRADLTPWDRDRLRLVVRGATEVWATRRVLRALLGGLVRSALERTDGAAVTVTVDGTVAQGSLVLTARDDATRPADLRTTDPLWLAEAPVDDVTVASLGMTAAASAARLLGGTLTATGAGDHTVVRIELPQRPPARAAS